MDAYNSLKMFWKWGCISCILLMLAACSTVGNNGFGKGDGAPRQWVDVSKIPNAVPRVEPKSPYGNPQYYVVDGYRYHVLSSAKGYNQVGYASWYGTKFHGKLTSNRERYNLYDMTAASTILPLPTYVRVTNLANGRSVIVRVNDRGPFLANRILDLSYAAAAKLGYLNTGTALVRVTAIDPATWNEYPIRNETRPQFAVNNEVTTATQNANGANYLQVGAFTNRATATTLGERIAKLTNTKVAIKPIYINNRLLYRVHIGPVNNNFQYQEIQQQLAQYGLGKPIAANS